MRRKVDPCRRCGCAKVLHIPAKGERPAYCAYFRCDCAGYMGEARE